MSLTDLRRNYTLGSLSESDLTPDPLILFDNWLQAVIDADIPDPNAMTLATVSESGQPSQRIVLLKGRPLDRFVFYTNYESEKARHIANNNQVSLHFPWYLMERQVMVHGKAHRLSETENDSYFSMRPKASQIGALASNQSTPIASREELVAHYLALSNQFNDSDVERPKHWGGYYVVPSVIEFWQGGEHRLHDRFRYTRSEQDDWTVARLQP